MSALYTKTTPKGIDIKIQDLQSYLYTKLAATWSTASYNSYGRCYKNITGSDGGFLPEVFTGSENYLPMLDVDKVNAFSFFVLGDELEKGAGLYKVEVALIFFCNLTKLKPTITHRADEEVRLDVLNLMDSELFGFKITSVKLGYDNVFEGFDVEKIKYDDLQPFHCFKIVGEMNYSTINNC
jgi:hypothetical protein